MTPEECLTLEYRDEVTWTDPDGSRCSQTGIIQHVDTSSTLENNIVHISLDNGSELECYPEELSWVSTPKAEMERLNRLAKSLKNKRVRIPKGVEIRSCGKSIVKVSKRSQVVRVDHTYSGYCKNREHKERLPEIVWAGSGGYWCWCRVDVVEVINED